MEYLLPSVIALLISTISGDVDISFMKAVPRLNNSMYCDYYFACHAEGETLQWIVNNNNISDYSGQNIDDVFIGLISTCNYTTTLLSLKPMPLGLLMLDSVLIVSCQSSIDFDISCTNGSVSYIVNIPEKRPNTRAENNITTVNLEHVLNKNLVAADSSSCTNIFVCGVDNFFIFWQSQGNSFAFTAHDNIGVVRQILQDTTTVKQQAILIGNEPYSLVVAMIVIGSAEVNVTCGYPDNTANLVSTSCLTNFGTTGFETSTVGEFSTMASGSSINLPLVLGVSITFGVLLIVAVIIIIVLGCSYNKIRLKRPKPIKIKLRSMEDEPDSGLPLRDNTLEIPLDNDYVNRIKKQKKRMSDIECDNDFFKQVEYIFLTRNKNTFNAATTFLTAPDIENTTNDQLPFIEEGVFIGMIESHPVCLVYETENNFIKKLQNVIIRYFSNTKYLVFVGRCFGIPPKKLKLADIVISSSIRHANEYQAKTELIAPEIRSTFCFYPEEVTGLKVTENRRAKHFVGNIASGVNILHDPNFRKFALACDDIYGCEETSGELLSLYENGINMETNTTKQIQVITIGAVTGFVDGDIINKYDEWQFIASLAAFHYVASKILHPHARGNICYKTKKPKPTRDLYKYEEFCKQIKYIISSPHPDDFDAATTNISAPNIEVGSDDIIEIDNGVYVGKIGSHPVGLLSFRNELLHLQNMGTAIIKYFPNAKYLVDVGGCYCTDKKKADLGDVLISEEICYISYDGESYCRSLHKMTTEIKNIFCYPQDVEGLELPGNRKARHFTVRIASARDIGRDKHMKTLAIASSDISAYEIIGGVLLNLKEILKHRGMIINIILVNGVFCYGDCEENIEWLFVATQAAYHYVCSKIKMQKANYKF